MSARPGHAGRGASLIAVTAAFTSTAAMWQRRPASWGLVNALADTT